MTYFVSPLVRLCSDWHCKLHKQEAAYSVYSGVPSCKEDKMVHPGPSSQEDKISRCPGQHEINEAVEHVKTSSCTDGLGNET
jgi:hypothetical protein